FANASPTIAPARIPASTNQICLPHAALSIFSSTQTNGGWEGRQRQRLTEGHSRPSISSANEISAHAHVNFLVISRLLGSFAGSEVACRVVRKQQGKGRSAGRRQGRVKSYDEL